MKKIIAWWSGGVSSAVAVYLAIRLFGIKKTHIVFMDTANEDDDTYRFLEDCERWYQTKIKRISVIGKKYDSIQDVWKRHKSLNIAKGAICSSTLKRDLRRSYQAKINFSHQVFGFDIKENRRIMAMKQHKDIHPIFPLAMYGLDKLDCLSIIENAGIEVPRTYQIGFHNNNCFKTGCVQGGIGYWQKMQREFPEKFDAMAKMEHDLTDERGSPVCMLKDQGKNGGLVFLKKHKDYPDIKDISTMKGREPKPLMECNGFCGTNDLEKKNPTYNELNYAE